MNDQRHQEMYEITGDPARLYSFVEQEIKPHARTWDETEQIAEGHIERLAGAGLLGMSLSADVDGGDLSNLETARAVAQVARGCGVSARLVVDSNFGAVQILDKWANEDIRQHYLPRVRTGEYLVSIAITEPTAGSAANELATTAYVYGDEVIIDGTKRWITGAGEREVYLVFARFDDVPGSAGIGAVLVDSETPGLEIGDREPTMGLRGLREGELHFQGCRVPIENVILPRGSFGKLMAAYNGQRVGASAVSLGLSRGSLDIAVEYAKRREQFGKPIAEFQAIQTMLADMAIQLDAAALLVERAAKTRDRYGFPLRYETSVAKTHASESGIFITNTAIQVLGGNGYSRNFEVERMARDARMFTIGGGTTQIQRFNVARKLLEN